MGKMLSFPTAISQSFEESLEKSIFLQEFIISIQIFTTLNPKGDFVRIRESYPWKLCCHINTDMSKVHPWSVGSPTQLYDPGRMTQLSPTSCTHKERHKGNQEPHELASLVWVFSAWGLSPCLCFPLCQTQALYRVTPSPDTLTPSHFTPWPDYTFSPALFLVSFLHFLNGFGLLIKKAFTSLKKNSS